VWFIDIIMVLKYRKGDVSLKIADYDVKWKEKNGFIWNDTLPHSVWNYTSETRIVIIQDVFRDFSIINSESSNIVHSLIQRTKHVNRTKNYHYNEGIVMD
jgi:aspartyl/asparaginyl beta-hydroxylase (cupin superfamily)